MNIFLALNTDRNHHICLGYLVNCQYTVWGFKILYSCCKSSLFFGYGSPDLLCPLMQKFCCGLSCALWYDDITSLSRKQSLDMCKRQLHRLFISLKILNLLSNLLHTIIQGFLLFKQHNCFSRFFLLVSIYLGP